MRRLGFLVVLGLPGCLTAPVERADAALASRVEQLGAEASRVSRETAAALDDVRARALADVASRTDAAVAAAEQAAGRTVAAWLRDADERAAARVVDLDGRMDRLRREALADIDARATAQREAAAADAAALLARVETESLAWREIAARAMDESARWREEVAAWRAEAASLRSAFTDGASVAGPAGEKGEPGPALPAEERYALYAALAGAVFTAAKTIRRLWLDRNTPRA